MPYEAPLDGLYAYTDPGELPQLQVTGGDQALPLEHTDVHAQVRGHVARVHLSQRFVNDRSEAIELTYTFPLPENAAVDDMRMVIGERVIESEVQTRDEASETFAAAREAGHTAALLEQERPNVFTQSVTNVPPGEAVEVEIDYLQTLSQDAGVYEFVFPMVVGPRFMPGNPTGTHEGSGTKADTDLVPDASRISPPVLGKGERSGHDLSLSLEVDAGTRVERWHVPTHTVVGASNSRGFEMRLADAETRPNRDFVLRWSAADRQPRATLFMGPPDAAGEGHFSLLVQPPQYDLDATVGRREMVFVIDRSGSMFGVPLALAKQTLRQALARLRPVDSFEVISFAGAEESLFGRPEPANEHNLMLAERFIDGMEAGGGTMMRGAIEAALTARVGPETRRYVFFLTDGYIGNEDEIFRRTAALVRDADAAGGVARVFGMGVGSSVNRHLISGISRAGEGAPLYMSNREHPAEAIDRYYRYVDHPVLDELSVDWGGLEVEGVFPSALPDLFASHAVIVHGQYSGELEGAPRLLAHAPGGEAVELPITVASSEHDERILSTLWARAKIGDLELSNWTGDLSEIALEQQTMQLGLEYHLVTAYTSLVAVDRSRVVSDGRPVPVVQTVEAPEDVDPAMAGAWVANGNAAGISLAGTSGAETKYSIDGAKVTNPSFGTVGHNDVMREYIATEGLQAEPLDRVGGSWANQAKLRLLDLRTEEGRPRALKRALRRRAGMFEACYLQHSERGRERAELALVFDASGKLIKIEWLSESFADEGTPACLESVLRGVEWEGQPDGGGRVELELDLSRSR